MDEMGIGVREPRLKEPIDLQEWINTEATKQDASLYAKEAGVHQAIFVRDLIGRLFFDQRDESPHKAVVQVVSYHSSKSVKLPVYYMDAREWLGVEAWLRGNFHNWIVSVRSERPIQDIFFSLFSREHIVLDVYAEGFIEDWVFGSYARNPREFTVSVGYANEFLWAFFSLMTECLRQGNVE